MRLQQASESYDNYRFKSSLTPNVFCNAIASGTALPTGTDSYVASIDTTPTQCAGFAFGYNLQKVSKDQIIDGVNLNMSNQYLEMTISNAPTNSLTAYFIAKLDILYLINMTTGDIEVRM